MKRTSCGCWTLLMVLLCAMTMDRGVAQGTFVVPSDLVKQMGGSAGFNPMLLGSDPTVTPYRYQEVFGSDDVSLPLGQYYITGVNFRLATLVGPPGGPRNATSLDAVLPAIEFRMSSTFIWMPDFLSPDYDRNHGSDLTVVVPRGPLHLTGTFDPNALVQAFSVHIPFSQPFFFKHGEFDSLLLDIINYGGSPVVAGFDAVGDRIDSVSIVAGHSLTSGTTATMGLVAQFEYTPIPEPSIPSLASMVLGAAFFRRMWLVTRRRSVCH